VKPRGLYRLCPRLTTRLTLSPALSTLYGPGLCDGVQTVRDSVIEAVRDEKLTPIEGISILACTTGQLFGYQAFHGQPQPAELLPYFLAGKRQ
jgi:hypothetical protein